MKHKFFYTFKNMLQKKYDKLCLVKDCHKYNFSLKEAIQISEDIEDAQALLSEIKKLESKMRKKNEYNNSN